MHLLTLYHWSPSGRYHSITALGLLTGQEPVMCSQPYPYICASPDPRTAWNLCAALADEFGVELPGGGWDLWAIAVADSDELHVRPEFGPAIAEVQIRNAIPVHRVWWVGRRHVTGSPAGLCR